MKENASNTMTQLSFANDKKKMDKEAFFLAQYEANVIPYL